MIAVTAAAARELNTLHSADPDYRAARYRFLRTGEMRVEGDPSRIGGWLEEVHPPAAFELTSPVDLAARIVGRLVFEDPYGNNVLASIVELQLEAVEALMGMEHMWRADDCASLATMRGDP
ncbi:hypothetical protein OLZ32_23485 [Rhizobium sp. 1AS11]|uniref:hypothetical protein n=1 Tax=Rhizobium acaciae TaxID=2989736 RepID=UPI0022220391|nr:hypothetical protein [Rhizobium acaciae]MCW1411249.1 hypothetical protein [Rhizobium acaciae]MCW1743339.1 hypothetical protein [Rhizobium acaciae]